MGMAIPPSKSRDPDRRLPPVHARLAQADAERAAGERRRALIPGPADPRARRRHDPHPLQEHGHAAPRAALDALPRRPLRAELRRRLRARLLRPDADVLPGQSYTYLLDGRRRLGRRLALPRPLAVDGWTRSPAACTGCSRSSAATSARPTASSRSCSRRWARLHDDRRPRVRRQHAGLPREGRRPRAVGRDGDGLRLPHLPRPRPPLDHARTAPRDTQTVGPAESFKIRWREDAPGTWLYHCHVEDHMMHGMIGIYRVSR